MRRTRTQMRRAGAIGLGVCALLAATSVAAQDEERARTHVLAVTGVVTNANLAPLNGWTVVVRNQTRGWERSSTSGVVGGHGVYSGFRMDSSAPVAEAGDTILIAASGPDGAHAAEATHTITETELERAHARISVRAPSLVSHVSIIAPEPDTRLVAGSDSVAVTIDAGDHVGGWSWWLDAPFPEGVARSVAVPTGNTTTAVGLHDRSTHTLYVGLTNGAGRMLSPAVVESVTISVGAAPKLSIVSPLPEQVFPPGTTSVPLTVDIVNPIGGWHWRLDDALEGAGLPGGVGVRDADGDTIRGLQDGRAATAYVTLIDEQGAVLDPPVTGNVRFFVAPAPPVAVILVGGRDLDRLTTVSPSIALDASDSWDPDGVITRYEWDFGDGAVDVGPVASHSYGGGPLIGGTYTVTLTVTDDDGQMSTDTLIFRLGPDVTQGPPPRVRPYIDISRDDPLELNALERSLGAGQIDGPLVTVGEPLTFDASQSWARFGEIAQFEWDFGDGARSDLGLADHAFFEPGVAFVTLTATDNAGYAATTDFMLVVLPTIELGATSRGVPGESFSAREGERLDIDISASGVGDEPPDISVDFGELAAVGVISARTDAVSRAAATIELVPSFEHAREEPYLVTVAAATSDDAASLELRISIRDALPWDVNGDDVIDIVDLVSVAWSFGGVPRAVDGALSGDVTRDGVVDIVDLVFVAAHFGESLTQAAPAMPSAAHTSVVATWIAQARRIAVRSQDPSRGAEFQRGLANLRSLLRPVAPTESALHQNYPNPFNPDTWIPFQLSEGADVTITIYDALGAAVRHIDLGTRGAGVYIAPDRAVHWNGRDDRGEHVASGAYFFDLRAGPYRKMRRMAVVK